MDHRICAHLLRAFAARDELNIAGFVPHLGEPGIQPALEALFDAGHRIYLPVIGGDRDDRSMHFARWSPGTAMESNRYGIPQPDSAETCPPARLDTVLCPLVAFTASGRRLGMGAGYYDRCFAFMREAPGPMLLGVAYALQEVDTLPVDEWDVPLGGVVTERGFRSFQEP